jgi:hypothetical protein
MRGEEENVYVPSTFVSVRRGRILGRNPDKSIKSFPPCYSQSPLERCLEISISSSSRNLLQFFSVQLLCTVKEKEGKPDRKPYHYLRNPYRNLKSESRLCPETSAKLYLHEFGFRTEEQDDEKPFEYVPCIVMYCTIPHPHVRQRMWVLCHFIIILILLGQ